MPGGVAAAWLPATEPSRGRYHRGYDAGHIRGSEVLVDAPLSSDPRGSGRAPMSAASR